MKRGSEVSPLTTIGGFVLGGVHALDALGLDGAAIALQAGVDPRDLEGAESRSPVSANLRFWTAAAEAADDPCFGLFAAAYIRPSGLHVLPLSVMSSDTIAEGLQRISRYSQVVLTGLQAEFQERGDRYTFVWKPPPGIGNIDIQMDVGVAFLVRALRFLTLKPDLAPAALRLRRAEPPCSARYLEIFGVEVSFSAERDEFEISKEVAETRISFSNKEVARACDVVAQNYLAQLDREAVAFRVQQAIIERLPTGDVQEGLIARLLGMSIRVLQRRLAEEETTFHQLLEDSRKVLARGYLEEGRWSVSEISYRLGFSEVSAFSRAFKRWTGEAPKNYAAERR